MKWILKTYARDHQPLEAIGTGGNINKIFSISKRKDGRPLSLDLLKDYYKELSYTPLEERKHLYQFRDDRADVIVPALPGIYFYYAVGPSPMRFTYQK